MYELTNAWERSADKHDDRQCCFGAKRMQATWPNTTGQLHENDRTAILVSSFKIESRGRIQYDHRNPLPFGLELGSMLSPGSLVGAAIVHNDKSGQFGDA